MVFQSKHIKGVGRGKQIGFPTINLTIPSDFILDDGVYAAWIIIDNKPYKGALHYGPIPTFDQSHPSMEVYLIDVTEETVPDTKDKIIEVDIVEHLRGVKRFLESEDLIEQIAKDVQKVNAILK